MEVDVQNCLKIIKENLSAIKMSKKKKILIMGIIWIIRIRAEPIFKKRTNIQYYRIRREVTYIW